MLGLAGCCLTAQAQYGSDWAWTPLFKHEGLHFAYIFYSEADNVNNGVVIKLTNENDYPIAYQFKVVFKSGEAEHVEQVRGTLKAGEAATGDTAGLFWVPFKDGRSIGEIGLRGYKVRRIAKATVSWPRG